MASMKIAMKIKEYDIKRLEDAKTILETVYGYYYGCDNRRFQWRLDTILNKLDSLIKIAKEGTE